MTSLIFCDPIYHNFHSFDKKIALSKTLFNAMEWQWKDPKVGISYLKSQTTFDGENQFYSSTLQFNVRNNNALLPYMNFGSHKLFKSIFHLFRLSISTTVIFVSVFFQWSRKCYLESFFLIIKNPTPEISIQNTFNLARKATLISRHNCLGVIKKVIN